MGQRKVDWIIPEWNDETELPNEIKLVMYDLYIQELNRKGGIRFSFNDFFDLDLSFVTMRKKYYKKAIIFLRKDKIEKIKNKLNE